MNKSNQQLSALNEKIDELSADLLLYKNKYEQAQQAYDQLLYNFRLLQRDRFGRKSERYIEENYPPQGNLFEELFGEEIPEVTPEDTDNENEDNVVTIAAHKRRKKKTKGFPPDLPRREIIIKAEDDMCNCGKKKKLIRYEITELLHHIPERYEVLVIKREVLACSDSCEGSITTAPNLPRILPKIKVTESVLAHMIVSKLHDRQPLYHFEQKLSGRFGIDITRDTLARWFIKTAQALQPLTNLMKDEVIDYDVASCDATSIQVLDEPGRAPTKKSYWYCIRGGPPDKKVILYDYNPSDHKIFMVNWFKTFKGYIHVDAQNIFDELAEQEGIYLVYCNAHARRKFEPIANNAQTDGLAKKAMRFYRKLSQIERYIKNHNLTPSQAFAYRNNMSKPILNEYKSWLDEYYPTTLPKSPLGNAFAYAIKRWPGLVRYLDDGRLEFDNNGTEQEIKPAVIARKNFLFAYSVAGVKALCVHMGLIRSAILHGLDPYHYYMKILRDTPLCQTVEDYEKLLPWNIDLKKVREPEVI